MDIKDRFGNSVNIMRYEKREQDLVTQYIEKDDVVFELGGRYGSVSCTINSKLHLKTNQVVVEPDQRVWDALERNKRANNCGFHIVKGFVSNKKLSLTNLDCYNGYGATSVEDSSSSVPSYTMKEIIQRYKLEFNVLVADCEGFLETFFDENPDFYNGLRLVMFEADYTSKCNYTKIRNELQNKGFREVVNGHQNVWIKSKPKSKSVVTPNWVYNRKRIKKYIIWS
jgi:FkbM family methyltransferase